MGSAIRVGVVGGGGWLGSAIVEAMLNAGIVEERNLSLSYRRKKPERFPGAFWTPDSQALADRCDVIILSVRPQDWPVLNLDAAGKLTISVMAGIPLAAICDRHGTRRAVRTIPNAAAEVGLSYTPWIATAETTEDDRSIVRAVFEACGAQDEVASERDLDYLTGLAGSGPAFPALLASAMVDHAVSFGLSRTIAEKAALTVLTGAGRLLEPRRQTPDQVVDVFLEYRGTTAAAIEAMRDRGFDSAVAWGLQRAFERSQALGLSSSEVGETGETGRRSS
ncbi:pyrroline-5-carboxylate reductase dimerization domain-containing protein [Mesorhizobium sp. LHD-90]|uniref:pyrroline-5-carboxylate reductase family protein n=1 Tax=Mesorhizobium sp. LHD-90 TaxID=3071414 RepID=UPI0027E1DD95|nr:pyrroline-5-carboxylate reductase dimerization domain-containing protein [Mesorhizobium sp. LHD-90]MDQ6432828.1 pyrroline-5-carboxylate reductase dimerization domain-containing protein [Mesorhizobium sp. LHD-90]